MGLTKLGKQQKEQTDQKEETKRALAPPFRGIKEVLVNGAV